VQTSNRPAPQKQAPVQKRASSAGKFDDDFDDDGYYAAPASAHKPSASARDAEAQDGKKKQNWFQRMWNGDDVEDLDNGWDDNEAPAAPKKKSGFKLFEVVDEDEE
jgi:hypothetical protein